MIDSIKRKIKQKSELPVFFVDAQQRIKLYHSDLKRARRFSRNGFCSHFFYTEDSCRYVSPKQRQNGYNTNVQMHKSFDMLRGRYALQSEQSFPLYSYYRRRSYGIVRPFLTALSSWNGKFSFALSPARAWNLSLVGAMIFGMIAMTMIYRSFGVSAYATSISAQPVHDGQFQESVVTKEHGNSVDLTPVAAAAREMATKNAMKSLTNAKERIENEEKKDPKQLAFENRAKEMLVGYPIEKMLPEIFKQDRAVAAMMIAMAKQESQWGRRVPVLNGEDCLNYWGFRSKRDRMGTGGHTCFDSNIDAVETVGRRIHELMYEYERKTAERMLVWKCGYSCAGHDPHNVDSWKYTVQKYYDKLMYG